MMQELKLPALAESVVEGEVLHWLVEVGDMVSEGQSVLEIMTDKVTVELPSPFSGVLREQRVKVGDVVEVGGVLALIEAAGDAPQAVNTAEPTPTQQQAAAGLQEERSIIESGAAIETDSRSVADIFSRPLPSRAAPNQTETSQTETSQAEASKGESGKTPPVQEPVKATSASARPVLAAPSARKLARQQGIDLAAVAGTGPSGVVRHADVLAFAQQPIAAQQPAPVQPPAPTPAPKPVEATAPTTAERRVPFKGQRRAISQGLMASLAGTALTHTIEELDTTELTALRDQLRPEAQAQGLKLSYMPFFLKAVALSLQAVPTLNSSLDEARQEIVFHGAIHLGIAINTSQGLIVPVVRDVQSKGLLALAQDVTDLTARALEGKLRPEELRGATFTVSNIGAVGALVGFPIVTPPSVGILSLHGIIRRPVAHIQGGEEIMAIRPMMYLTLGFDHRLVDGVDAVQFTKRVVELLEQPNKMLL